MTCPGASAAICCSAAALPIRLLNGPLLICSPRPSFPPTLPKHRAAVSAGYESCHRLSLEHYYGELRIGSTVEPSHAPPPACGVMKLCQQLLASMRLQTSADDTWRPSIFTLPPIYRQCSYFHGLTLRMRGPGDDIQRREKHRPSALIAKRACLQHLSSSNIHPKSIPTLLRTPLKPGSRHRIGQTPQPACPEHI